MGIDWAAVKPEHVHKACELFDAGTEIPARPAQSTFLIVNSRRYPAKFIRGLAHQIATEVRPTSDEYSGGLETVAFFRRLGFTTQHQPTGMSSTAPVRTGLSPESPAVKVPLSDRQAQKQALKALLEKRFGAVEQEASFDWLIVPDPQQMDGLIRQIFLALEGFRGQTGFATSGYPLHCDFYIPDHNLIVEYDERQHFTLPRALTLKMYPADLPVHFDQQAWIAACEKIKANDPTPPYRDEQRAFYDSLRDVLAARNGIRLLRIRDGVFDWTRADAAQHLDKLISGQRQDEKPPVDCALSDSDRATVIRYLSRDPKRWYWEDMVRDLLGRGNEMAVRVAGQTLRSSYGKSPRLQDFPDEEIARLVGLVRSSTTTSSEVDDGEQAVVVRVSRADRATVTGYLQMNPNKWYWEELVGDILETADKSTVAAIGSKVRKMWGKSPTLGAFNDTEIARLVLFIRSEAGGSRPSLAPAYATVAQARRPMDRL